jgi:copper resistance protein D
VIDDPLIYVRAVHFAAALTVAGAVFFIIFIAEPAFRQAENSTRVAVFVRLALAWIGWIGLVVTAVTGVAWLVLVAESMSASPLPEVFSEGILWTVLLQTSFGRDWLTRAVLVSLLAGMFVPFLSVRGVKSVWLKIVLVVLAVGLAGTLAWAGHAVGGSGIEAITHPAADFLHLVAAAAWVGMLLPLALVLAAAGRDPALITVARTTTVRFSTFGIASVGTLLVTGSINTWYLVGSATALTDTYYGRLLLTKVALFFGMVAIAALNRLHFTPRLVQVGSGFAAQNALRRLRRNTAIQVVMGIVIICIVAVLGVTPHGSHHHSH